MPEPRVTDSLIHVTFLKKLPSASAADQAGWRYEYLQWTFNYGACRAAEAGIGSSVDNFIPGRGADALTALSRRFIQGHAPPPS